MSLSKSSANQQGLPDFASLNLRDFLEEAARAVPDQLFLTGPGGDVTYQDFNQRSNAAANVWYQQGVRKGDRVAIMLENCQEFLYAWFGLAMLGAILVAINTRWRAKEVAYLLGHAEPRFALVGAQFLDVFGAAMASGHAPEEIFSLGDVEGFAGFCSLMSQAAPEAPRTELAADDVVSLIYTSGTTGRPKAVMQTHGNYVLTGQGYAHWIELQRGERIYVCLPLFHINSQAYSVQGAIAARATIVLVEKFSATRFWSDLDIYGVNVFNYIGAMLMVLAKAEARPEDAGHMVRVAYGAPALLGPLRAEIEERFGLTMISGFGMSETTYGLIESLHGERRSGSMGKPRQHPDPRLVNEARMVDDAGRDAPPGEPGELILRNPVTMKGYFRDPEQTAKAIRDGWLFTGDLVRRDEDGFFYYVDRKKDIIRRRGENVSPAEVEQVINAHPSVAEVAVVAVPSELTDEDIAAFVVLKPEARLAGEEIIAWCRQHLADFKAPHYLWFVSSLPKTPTEKVEKHRLRRMAHEMLAEEPGDATPKHA